MWITRGYQKLMLFQWLHSPSAMDPVLRPVHLIVQGVHGSSVGKCTHSRIQFSRMWFCISLSHREITISICLKTEIDPHFIYYSKRRWRNQSLHRDIHNWKVGTLPEKNQILDRLILMKDYLNMLYFTDIPLGRAHQVALTIYNHYNVIFYVYHLTCYIS